MEGSCEMVMSFDETPVSLSVGSIERGNATPFV